MVTLSSSPPHLCPTTPNFRPPTYFPPPTDSLRPPSTSHPDCSVTLPNPSENDLALTAMFFWNKVKKQKKKFAQWRTQFVPASRRRHKSCARPPCFRRTGFARPPCFRRTGCARQPCRRCELCAPPWIKKNHHYLLPPMTHSVTVVHWCGCQNMLFM